MTAWILLGLVVSAKGSEADEMNAKAFATMHSERPIVIAHRGASHAAPENTLSSYRLAIEEGATIAETDVHLTKDGVVVVMHDTTVDRTTAGTGSIAEHTASELTSLEAGSWFDAEFDGEPVPTLKQLLTTVGQELIMCIEVKAGDGIVEEIANLVDELSLRHRVILFSFDHQQIAFAKALMPDVPALVLFKRPKRRVKWGGAPIRVARELGVDVIGLDRRSVSATFVRRAHDAGFPVFVYTVNSAIDIMSMMQMGVDGLITDRPEQTRGLVEGGLENIVHAP